MFGAIFLAFPIIAAQVYMFVAPGLYKHERGAFIPYLIATPVLFLTGAALVYYGALPIALNFFMSMEQTGGEGAAKIELLPKVSEYLNLVTAFILAFGICFQLPVLLTLMGKAGLVSAEGLGNMRKYAVVGILTLAALVTPPDVITQLILFVVVYGLYEISIQLVRLVERKRDRELREEGLLDEVDAS